MPRDTRLGLDNRDESWVGRSWLLADCNKIIEHNASNLGRKREDCEWIRSTVVVVVEATWHGSHRSKSS